MSDKESRVESWGESTVAFMLAVILAVVLFKGDPDIADSLRVAAEKWAVNVGQTK